MVRIGYGTREQLLGRMMRGEVEDKEHIHMYRGYSCGPYYYLINFYAYIGSLPSTGNDIFLHAVQQYQNYNIVGVAEVINPYIYTRPYFRIRQQTAVSEEHCDDICKHLANRMSTTFQRADFLFSIAVTTEGDDHVYDFVGIGLLFQSKLHAIHALMMCGLLDYVGKSIDIAAWTMVYEYPISDAMRQPYGADDTEITNMACPDVSAMMRTMRLMYTTPVHLYTVMDALGEVFGVTNVELKLKSGYYMSKFIQNHALTICECERSSCGTRFIFTQYGIMLQSKCRTGSRVFVPGIGLVHCLSQCNAIRFICAPRFLSSDMTGTMRQVSEMTRENIPTYSGVIIQAPLGSGKSKWMLDTINELCVAKRSAICVVVTNRIVTCSELYKELCASVASETKVLYYNDVPREVITQCALGLNSTPVVLVVCLPSLYKFSTWWTVRRGIDAMFIDEFQGCIADATSGSYSDTITTLRNASQGTKITICLDGHIGALEVEYMREFMGNRLMMYVGNCVLRCKFHSKFAKKEDYPHTFHAMCAQIARSAANGRSQVIMCDSRGLTLHLCKEVMACMAADGCQTMSAAEELQRLIDRADVMEIGQQCIDGHIVYSCVVGGTEVSRSSFERRIAFFSPVVTAGINWTDPVDDVYAFVSWNPLIAIQQLMRVRNPKMRFLIVCKDKTMNVNCATRAVALTKVGLESYESRWRDIICSSRFYIPLEEDPLRWRREGVKEYTKQECKCHLDRIMRLLCTVYNTDDESPYVHRLSVVRDDDTTEEERERAEQIGMNNVQLAESISLSGSDYEKMEMDADMDLDTQLLRNVWNDFMPAPFKQWYKERNEERFTWEVRDVVEYVTEYAKDKYMRDTAFAIVTRISPHMLKKEPCDEKIMLYAICIVAKKLAKVHLRKVKKTEPVFAARTQKIVASNGKKTEFHAMISAR